MLRISLLRPGDLKAPFAARGGLVVSRAAFLRDVAALAALLPDRRYVANLCRDRYRFAVGFAAALCRGQITLLPPSQARGPIAAVLSSYDDAYSLCDEPQDGWAYPMFTYPALAAGDLGPVSVPEFPADRIAAILFTSGSTGLPRPHPRSWGLLVSSALAAGEAIGAAGLAGASLVGTVPHQHSYGLESLVVLAWQHGLLLRAEMPFFPADIVALLAEVPRPRILVTTPVHLRALLAESDDVPPVDLLLLATAPLALDLARVAEAAFAAPLFEIYGCSEVGQLAARRSVQTELWQCLDGITLRQDAEGSWACGAAIAVETLLADVIDLADPAHFRLLGRMADQVNIAGKRSSLAYLTAHLLAIDGVEDAIFLLPDEPSTERLAALVVAPHLTEAAILAALRVRIDPAFLPRPLRRVDRLPRDALGKVPRAAVACLLRRSGGA
jgi:acyl-coenzyme A synthetase/AMP-(fatty) acid ligase